MHARAKTEPALETDHRRVCARGFRWWRNRNLIADAVAVMPGVKGTAAEAVNRTVGAVSAARSFLDDLRGHR